MKSVCSKSKKLLFTTLFVFYVPTVMVSQQSMAGGGKAREIITNSRRAISEKTDVSKLRSFYLLFDGTVNYFKELTEKNEFSIELPDKINHTLSSRYESGQGILIRKLSGFTSSYKKESSWTYGQTSEYETSKNPKDGSVIDLKYNASLALLPIIIDFAFIPTEFRYLGVARAENSTADVIEAKLSNGKNFKLLFDKKTNRLVMMLLTYIDDGKQQNRKFYFSNYKKHNGLMIPHKIIMTGISTRNTNIYVEKNLIKFESNPKFKPETFEIKPKKK